MKASDARNRTHSAIAKKKEDEAAAERDRLRDLESARARAKADFDNYFKGVLNKVVEAADNGKNSTSCTFVARLDVDGSHGPAHAYDTELAKLTARRLKADGYVVDQTTKADRMKDNDEIEHQVVVIELEITW